MLYVWIIYLYIKVQKMIQEIIPRIFFFQIPDFLGVVNLIPDLSDFDSFVVSWDHGRMIFGSPL